MPLDAGQQEPPNGGQFRVAERGQFGVRLGQAAAEQIGSQSGRVRRGRDQNPPPVGGIGPTANVAGLD